LSPTFFFWNAPIIGKLILYLSFVSSLLLFLIGQFNLGEIPVAHNLIAWFGFCRVVILNLLSVIGEIICGQEKWTALKLSCVAVPLCNLVGLAFISRVETTALQFNLLGAFEYIVVIGGCIGTALYYFNFQRIQVLFCVEIPSEDVPETDDLPKNIGRGGRLSFCKQQSFTALLVLCTSAHQAILHRFGVCGNRDRFQCWVLKTASSQW
jgi:hypothetical protein